MDGPIRILQVLTVMNLGGAETMIMNYYRNVDREKVQFDFLLHRPERGFFDDEIESLGGKIFRMPAISPKTYLSYKKQLNVFFKSHPEYSIVHSHLNALSCIILKVAKKYNIPVRIAHSHLAVEPFILKKILKKNTDVRATVKDATQSLIRHNVPKFATHYFSCGEKAGQWLFGKRNGVTIINNAINSKKFAFDTEMSSSIKADLNITNKKVIGHVGRFNEQKNHFFLIRVFNEILKKNKNCVLMLIGDGNLKSAIEQEAEKLGISESILFLGVRKNIPELLQAFDVFLFPSLYEGLPVTLIEAQASGLNIVTSDTVTQEVNITNQTSFLSLKDPLEKWADITIASLDYNRMDTTDQIKKGGYDIYENAKNLQEFYLNTNAYVRN